MKILFPICLLFILMPHLAGATSVSPATIDLQLDPGQSGTYEIKLYNETKEDIFLTGSIEKFVPKGENGEAEILPFDITDKSVNWLKLPNNSLVLKAGEEISVPIIIDVPKTADIGGYYLAIMWESSPGPKSEKSHQTLISSRVGVLVLLTVKGGANANLEIVDFDLKDNKIFYIDSSLDFFLRLRNTGNVHQRPQGSIIIKNFLGKTVEALPINFEKGAILPNTTRVFEVSWNNSDDKFKIISNLLYQLRNFTLGRFSAKAIVDYGHDKSLVSEPIYFWIIPWPLVVFILVILFLLFIVIRKIKHKNKKI